MTTRDGKGRGNARGMTTMKRERRRTMRRVVGVVAVAVRDRLRDFCFCLLFLVRLVTIGLLGCPSNRARRRDDDDDDDGASTEWNDYFPARSVGDERDDRGDGASARRNFFVRRNELRRV
jgi:hypothetical protein